MKKYSNLLQILFCVGLSCMMLLLPIGYAAVSGSLSISGTATYDELKAIYITAVSESAHFGHSGDSPAVAKVGSLAFQHNNYTLQKQINEYITGGYVEVTVTVKNNSGVPQYLVKQNTTPENNRLVGTFYQIELGDPIPQGAEKTFTVRLQNTNTENLANMNEAVTHLHFSPQFSADDTEKATEDIAKIFANVLADRGPTGEVGDNGEYIGIQYQGRYIPSGQIVDTIMDQMENVDTGGYMGNVGNASDDQKELIEAIFGENVIMQIGNYYYTVQVLIKNQRINNDDQNDMVLYVTADQLDVGGGRWQAASSWWEPGKWVELNRVPVYGLVFVYNSSTGQYDYVDHLFAGTAPVCDFGGTLAAGATGNFNTNLWESTEFSVSDESGGDITESYITTNGELDEAYGYYIANYIAS